MTTNAVELVKRFYGSLGQGRRQDLLSILDPEIVLEIPQGFPGGRSHYRGFREYFEDFLDAVYGSIELEFIPEEFLESGLHVITTGRLKGRGTGSGVAFNLPFVHVWTSNGRLLSHARFFTDTAILRDAIAGRPTATDPSRSS